MKTTALPIVVSLLAGMQSSCSLFSRHPLMSGRNELYSFMGPGSDKVERGLFPGILFAEGSALLAETEKSKLEAVSKFLRDHPSARLLLAGFAGEEGTDEYNRILGEQRAQVVRHELIEKGCSPASLQTLSYGRDQSGTPGRCVQFGIVR